MYKYMLQYMIKSILENYKNNEEAKQNATKKQQRKQKVGNKDASKVCGMKWLKGKPQQEWNRRQHIDLSFKYKYLLMCMCIYYIHIKYIIHSYSKPTSCLAAVTLIFNGIIQNLCKLSVQNRVKSICLIILNA